MKVLVASLPPLARDLAQLLGDHNVFTPTTITQAERLIEEDGIDCFIIGVHFDDFQGVALAKTIRTHEHHRSTPIIFVRMLPMESPGTLRQSMELLKIAGMISEYLELANDPDYGPKIRAAVERATAQNRPIV